MIALSTFPGAIKPIEQKIGTFGPQTEPAGDRGGRLQTAQQISRSSHTKVQARKGPSGGSNAENSRLSAKMREVRGWSLKALPRSWTSQMGCFIYFWNRDAKATSWCSHSGEIFALGTPARIQLHHLKLVLSSHLGTAVCLPLSMLRAVLGCNGFQTVTRLWNSQFARTAASKSRAFLASGHGGVFLMTFPVGLDWIHNLPLKTGGYAFTFYIHS